MNSLPSRAESRRVLGRAREDRGIRKYCLTELHFEKIGASLIAQLVKNTPAMQETPV